MLTFQTGQIKTLIQVNYILKQYSYHIKRMSIGIGLRGKRALVESSDGKIDLPLISLLTSNINMTPVII